MTQPAPTKEQIAAKKLRDLGVKLVELMNVPANELAYSPYEDAADLRKIASLIEALTAQLAEARSALHSLAEFRSQDISIMRGYLERAEQAEAAAASARETALEEGVKVADEIARQANADLDDPELCAAAGVRVLAADRIADSIRALKSQPPANGGAKYSGAAL